MSHEQYSQYLNVHIFAEKYRKYEKISEILDEEKFRKTMQYNSYVKIQYVNKKNGKPVLIYLLAKGSKYAEQSQELKKLLSKIKDPSNVMLISQNKFKVYSMKSINAFNHLKVKTYLHENFSLIIPNGPLCYNHRIMSASEIDNLLNNVLFCHVINLPKILDDDPQCIWIGAEVGDVVEITASSDISGEYVSYRLVVAKSGRVISFRSVENNATKEKPEEEEETEEVKNFREEADNEIED